jgi:hypothetical protein
LPQHQHRVQPSERERIRRGALPKLTCQDTEVHSLQETRQQKPTNLRNLKDEVRKPLIACRANLEARVENSQASETGKNEADLSGHTPKSKASTPRMPRLSSRDP